jgi:hypothetical protein
MAFSLSHSPLIALASLLLIAAGGCAAFPAGGPPAGNPVYVRANNGEFVWERTVDVLHEYHFELEREDKLGGVIETRYRVGSSWLEPWHADSVGPANRWESTLQSIRRKAFVSVTPVEGGYMIGVEALKELEDVANADPKAGRATFLDNTPLARDLDVVSGLPTPAGWIPEGRDPELEQSLLRSLSSAFSR